MLLLYKIDTVIFEKNLLRKIYLNTMKKNMRTDSKGLICAIHTIDSKLPVVSDCTIYIVSYIENYFT